MANECDDSDVKLSWPLVSEVHQSCSPSAFWSGLDVWLTRPHILNRRISAVNTVLKLTTSALNLGELIDLLLDVRHKLGCHLFQAESLSNIETVLRDSLQQNSCDYSVDEPRLTFVIEVREVYPKCLAKYCKMFEIVVRDTKCFSVTFISLVPSSSTQTSALILPRNSYTIQFCEADGNLKLLVLKDSSDGDSLGNVLWLKNVVFSKVCKWIKEANEDRKKMVSSLSLISEVKYVLLYNELKEKYGSHLVKIWPERTDPSKFVYEDIAIASYLMVLWQQERNSTDKQSFVDLGCGNGLLTHILCSEGYSGIGIDIKKRNIWNLYGEQTKLIVGSITPSSEFLFPEYDWIIGNHSDELTPWIPVISARSSLRTRFFLLPCCAHNFNCKFQRRNSKLSQYEDYIEFLTEIIQVCGFHILKDKLRIPSTKRICLVGQSRTHGVDEWPAVNERLTNFINEQSTNSVSMEPTTEMDNWISSFRVRDAEQPVRNCTTLPQSIKENIVKVVFDAVFASSLDKIDVVVDDVGKTWRRGGVVELPELAKVIEPSVRQKLKNEFGGLQTLLRNHHHIFQVIHGKVCLRNYVEGQPLSSRKRRTKSTNSFPVIKPCWFNVHHPDGCPLSSTQCFFAHS